jgi:hypothetical protein
VALGLDVPGQQGGPHRGDGRGVRRVQAQLDDADRGRVGVYLVVGWDVQEAVVEADRVASYFWTRTHQGEFLGVPATGRSVKVEAWNLDRFQDGQLTESRIMMDVMGLLTQLGVVPAPAAS